MDPKLWELWYIPYNGSCRILSINSIWAHEVSGMVLNPRDSKFGKLLSLGMKVEGFVVVVGLRGFWG